MADKFINQLPVASLLDSTELLPLMQGGVTKQVTAQALIFQPSGVAQFNAILTGGVLASANVQAGGTLKAVGAFSANNATPQAAAAVNAACIDLPTAVALVNQLRAALVANGICV
jgi:hypothetical protein